MVEKIKKAVLFCLLFLLLISSTLYFSTQRWCGTEKWKWIIAMDGRGYYAYLPALFVFSDPTFSFYEKHTQIEGDIANFSNKTETGNVNKYYYGEALLLAPFFLTAHFVANIAGYPTTGYSQPYYFGVLIASIFYFLAGIYFLWLLFRSFRFSKITAFIACFAFALGTNLFYYAVYEPSMSHVYSFFAIAAFLFFCHSYFVKPQKRSFIIAAFFIGLILIIRPVNGLILSVIPFIAGDAKQLKNGFLFILKNYITLILSLFIVVALIFGQLLLYYWQTGQLIIWSYKDEGFNFGNPQIANSLFSYMKGFFVYTPVALVSLGGLFLFLIKKHYLFFSGLIPVCIIIFVVSSWHAWSYGWSYGLRAYIDYYSFFALLLAYLIEKCFKKKWSSVLIILLLIATTALSATQTYQINKRILHFGEMDKERYWKVFCKTDLKYENIFYDTQDQTTETSLLKVSQSQVNDMEGQVQWLNMTSVKKGIAHSGNCSSVVDGQNQYSVTFCTPFFAFDSIGATHIRAGAWIYTESNDANPELIISFENDKGSYSYNAYSLFNNFKIGEWSYAENTCKIMRNVGEHNIVKVYFFSKSGIVYVDDMKIDFLK